MLRELSVAFAIMVVCVAIHITGMAVMADQILDRRERLERRSTSFLVSVLLFLVFTALVVLHFAEAGVWALFYKWNDLFPNFETCLYFSLGTYSTIGYGDIVLPSHWRILGAIEGISGVLLCGLSTAFLLALINAGFKLRMERKEQVRS
jgi:voltage-gated potassium channel